MDAASNFSSGTSLIANSNMLAQKFDKAAGVIKNSGSEKDRQIALQKFEGMFISQMMKLMFDTVPVDENFGGGFAEETFRDFLTDEYGTLISKSGGIGIVDSLQKSVSGENSGTETASKTLQANKAYNKIYNL
jgi:Rod binding domain-containing protein